MRTCEGSMQARKAGNDVVGKGENHHQHQDQRTCALELLLPPFGKRAAGQTLEKIIHQVSAIEHRQRQQVEDAETHAYEREKTQKRSESKACRLACVVSDRQG